MDVGAVKMGGAAGSSSSLTGERPAVVDSTVKRAPVDNSVRRDNADAGAAIQSKAQIQEMVAEMQKQIDMMNVSLSFSAYGKNNERIAVVVSNKETQEVIREIPPEELQILYTKMREAAAYIFNQKI
jgi:flagellar protein FlaG